LSNAQVGAHIVTGDVEFVAVWEIVVDPTIPTGTTALTHPSTGN